MTQPAEKPKDKVELELRELDLKVTELEWKVKELSTPVYRKPAFWTTTISVLIGVVGIAGQSILSNIKNEKAKLELERANVEIKAAQVKKDSAIQEIAAAQKRKAEAMNEIAALEQKRKRAQEQLDSTLLAFTRVLADRAYDKDPNASAETQTSKAILAQSTKNISRILEVNAGELLLKSARLTVYYVPQQKTKAIEIDRLLKANGVTSKYDTPNYDIDQVVYNEIVYYNEPQLIYCRAVQKLLAEKGYGDFKIRLSTGANATYRQFKIYVVR